MLHEMFVSSLCSVSSLSSVVSKCVTGPLPTYNGDGVLLCSFTAALTGIAFVCLRMVCQFCCKIFTHKQAFVFHLRAVHKLGEPVKCHNCGKDDFKSLNPYYVHTRKCKQ